jgi:hypothetical protein
MLIEFNAAHGAPNRIPDELISNSTLVESFHDISEEL